MDLQGLFAERIGGTSFGTTTETYKFEKIKRAKAEARRAHPDLELLDFGVGEPDGMAPRLIRDELKRAVDDPSNRGYADNGIREFNVAASRYMENLCGVAGLDPDTQINHSIGSKPALAMIPLCFVNPGDVSLVTVPGYPVLATHTRYLGGEVVGLPLLRENGFYPDLTGVDADTARRAKLLYVNYPNNPTGAAPSEDFFDALIAFADAHDVLIVHDAAYATLVYDRETLSILSRPGGMENAIELHSMSKSYNMTGWRLGFVAGSPLAIRAFAEVKDNIDSGQFKAIQHAACAGIASTEVADEIREHYAGRLRKLVVVLKAAGFDAAMPGGTFYLYVPAPSGGSGSSFETAADVSQYLILNQSISTVPWDDAGKFLRFSGTFESSGPEDDDRVMAELGRRLVDADLRF